MQNWDEIRTAYQVARLGTVSAAAEVLGVHHATVIRHIDALETRLKVRLFQRHARGYAATDAGQDLMRVAAQTDDQFAQMQGRLHGQGDTVSGELVVTSLAGFSPFITPHLAAFRGANPDVTLRFVASNRIFRLEYGEAHVAIRAGAAPQEPDNVVQSLGQLHFVLTASEGYVANHGRPTSETFAEHAYIGSDIEGRSPFNKWLTGWAAPERVVYRTSDMRAVIDAVEAGIGIGLLPTFGLEQSANLMALDTPNPEHCVDIWLVTHVDLHRTAKVQAFSKFIKSAIGEAIGTCQSDEAI